MSNTMGDNIYWSELVIEHSDLLVLEQVRVKSVNGSIKMINFNHNQNIFHSVISKLFQMLSGKYDDTI